MLSLFGDPLHLSGVTLTPNDNLSEIGARISLQMRRTDIIVGSQGNLEAYRVYKSGRQS